MIYLSRKIEMKRHILVLVLALASQACAQVLVDNLDPRLPRPGATFPSPVDHYGVARPGIDPSGASYRPSGAGVLLEPAGAGRPTGLPLAYDPMGYANGYAGLYGGAYDSFFARPPAYGSPVSGPYVFPETLARVPVSPSVVVPFMPLSTVSVAPAPYPVAASGPVNFPAAPPASVTYPVSFNPMFPASVSSSVPFYPGIASNLPGVGPIFPGTSSLSFGSGGLSNVPGAASLPNLPVGSGNLQLGSGAHPLNPGNGVFGGSSSSIIPNGNFIQPA